MMDCTFHTFDAINGLFFEDWVDLMLIPAIAAKYPLGGVTVVLDNARWVARWVARSSVGFSRSLVSLALSLSRFSRSHVSLAVSPHPRAILIRSLSPLRPPPSSLSDSGDGRGAGGCCGGGGCGGGLGCGVASPALTPLSMTTRRSHVAFVERVSSEGVPSKHLLGLHWYRSNDNCAAQVYEGVRVPSGPSRRVTYSSPFNATNTSADPATQQHIRLARRLPKRATRVFTAESRH